MTDTSSFLEDVWELFSWRILSNYVSPWELSQIKAEIKEWDRWCGVWSSWARRHVDRGDATAAAKQSIMGALNLYLDFINMFVMLLQLFGNRE